MAKQISITTRGFDAAPSPTIVVFVGDDRKLPTAAATLKGVAERIGQLLDLHKFKGGAKSAATLVGHSELPCERLVVVGLGKTEDRSKINWTTAGGVAAGKLAGGAASVICALGDTALTPAEAAEVALGMRLRSYNFDKYKTKKDKDKAEDEEPAAEVALHGADAAALKKALKAKTAIAEGVDLARELVNEPPNVLNPESFAKRAKALGDVGVEVEVLGEKELKKIGMRALLGVGQGSHNESQVVIMRWNGAKDSKAQPVAFIGKGVTFDTGGISIKPAGGMEDMKGDMAGAACVTGLMHALAARKAKVNAIGVIGLVENMPDGKAQRPGDIVTSLSGQTIEIINTDAEGRLVLADVLWHVQATFKPQFMIDLATLTGAILVALGQERAGLFSNNDELSNRLTAAGEATGERVWRMPLDPAYDKIIDSKFADVKNSGGRYAGSITAAQFLQRFVNDCPWAHLDVAGTAMGAGNSDTNRSWGPGWGVRLLDRLVADHYEDR